MLPLLATPLVDRAAGWGLWGLRGPAAHGAQQRRNAAASPRMAVPYASETGAEAF